MIDTGVVIRCMCDSLALADCRHRVTGLAPAPAREEPWRRFPGGFLLKDEGRTARPASQERCPLHGSLLSDHGSDQRLNQPRHDYSKPVCYRCLEEKPDDEVHSLTLQQIGRGPGRRPKAPTAGSLNPREYTHLAEEYPKEDRGLAYRALTEVCRRANRPKKPDHWLRRALKREVRMLLTREAEREDSRLDVVVSRLGSKVKVHQEGRDTGAPYDERPPGRARQDLWSYLYSSGGSAESEYMSHD